VEETTDVVTVFPIVPWILQEGSWWWTSRVPVPRYDRHGNSRALWVEGTRAEGIRAPYGRDPPAIRAEILVIDRPRQFTILDSTRDTACKDRGTPVGR